MTWRRWRVIPERPWLWQCGMCDILHQSMNGALERARRSDSIVDGLKFVLKELRRSKPELANQMLALIAELERMDP